MGVRIFFLDYLIEDYLIEDCIFSVVGVLVDFVDVLKIVVMNISIIVIVILVKLNFLEEWFIGCFLLFKLVGICFLLV